VRNRRAHAEFVQKLMVVCRRQPPALNFVAVFSKIAKAILGKI
jgi:hypothetical protein